MKLAVNKENDKVVLKIGFKNKVKREENSWPLTIRYSTNHANLFVIVASRVSLAITNPWLQETFQSMKHKIIL